MAEPALQAVPRMGCLHGISLGPGDPGLITRAAWAALQRRDAVWVYPVRSGKTPSYALDIVQRAGICGGGNCRNLLDFTDAVVDEKGYMQYGYADGCLGSCELAGPNSFQSQAVIARQSFGK